MRKLEIKDADIMRLTVEHEIQRSEESLLGGPQSLLHGKLLSHHLPQQFGVSIGIRQCRRLFYQSTFRRRKPRPIVPLADPLTQLILKYLQRLTLRNDISHWFEDECHFQRHGSRCVLRAPAKEMAPALLNMPIRENVAY